uniref:Intercellular adhesion molecule 5 n=1 Tax=Poecilia formosa TaxID=48698 RepID=A0A096M1V9_POEFO
MTEWILFVQLFVGLLLIPGEDASCAIELTPPRVVVKYGDPVSVKCTTSAEEFDGLGWEASEGGTGLKEERYVMLTVQSVAEWDNNPMCFITSGTNQCSTRLGLVIYTFPENISISSSIESSEEMRENEEYILTCSILNIAPVQNLTVRWYQGNQIIYSENLTNSTKKPTNQTSIFRFTPTRQDDRTTIRTLHGLQVKCEAELNLGPEGPQPPPLMTSDPFTLSVHYKPRINTTKLPELVPVISGYKEELVCEADGNPAPTVAWNYTATAFLGSNGMLTVNEEGTYICIANNSLAIVKHEIKVILTEDYLPLLAGFVALTVVAISIIFIFIYSIYYKNTKMRRYNLKNPKLSIHNGNVAHNGWDIQLPVTKLS